MQTTKILDIPFAVVTTDEALAILEGWLDTSRNHIIVTPNPEGVMQARRNTDFAIALKTADLSLADGTGIVLASYMLKPRLPERVRGVDTIFALFKRLTDKEKAFTAYFLGAAPGIAEAAKTNMEARFPYMKVVGYHHGFFTEGDEPKIIAEINECAPDILLICTGMPRAEIWATKHRAINCRLTLSLGGTLDIMGGSVKLAPPIFRKLGLEWLYRLASQPSRFMRMLDIPRFVVAVIIHALTKKERD
ncbi:MAG: WecB/TagA/CpsF family glycosyltransferase [Defluviitaleaceae bacterium]|nr:WecB/TagA/CpsF family glycosyltransferase [Defluviitaleaceae bacterium]